MAAPTTRARRASWIGIAATVALTTLLLAWLMGAFRREMPPGPALDLRPRAAADAPVHVVQSESVPVFETAMGSIKPARETSIGAQILARVKEIKVDRAGIAVAKGDVLALLDDEELTARLEEARAAERAAAAEANQAESDLNRTLRLFEQGLTSKGEQERAETLAASTKAALERARQSTAAATTAIEHATIRAPFAGIIIDKLAQAGDMVMPGQSLFALYDPTHMQLVASVREALGARLQVGEEVDVEIAALDLQCKGVVDQIVPRAEAGSRAFEVKVSGPCPPEIRAGMFGRMSIKTGEAETIFVPLAAVQGVGQLDMVQVVNPESALVRRFVRLGMQKGDRVEVLSGLAPGERILARSQP